MRMQRICLRYIRIRLLYRCFYYTSIEEMKDTIAFWKREYQSRYYVRWAIIDKNANQAIGTIELFNREAKDYFNNCN